MKVVLAPNAFKGSLRASAVAAAMAEGVRRVLPDAEVEPVPVADGGDGLVDVIAGALGGEVRTAVVTGPRGESVQAAFCFVPERRLAAVEMALASGLALLDAGDRDPEQTTTRGTGELIRAALDLGAEKIIVGVGGSATNDGGIGMAQALGVRFLDGQGRELPGIGAALGQVATIDRTGLDPRIGRVEIEVACDVDSPLYGPSGAAHVYGPQKGATPAQVERLDQGLRHLAQVVRRDLGVDMAAPAGAGAAGGLGGGLWAFLGARLRKGIDMVLELVELRTRLEGAALVFTGEGQMDAQTAFGKAPAGVARMAREAGVPCIAVAGSVGEGLEPLHEMGIDAVFSLCPGPITLEQAMSRTSTLVARITEQALRAFLAGTGHGASPSGANR